MPLFTALPTEVVEAYRQGGPDAHGNIPERHISDGDGNPCRHCLTDIPSGTSMLVLAHKPFHGTHPYAEVGPIFLCAEPCPKGGGTALPQVLTTSPDFLLKGYNSSDRIVYGTGVITPYADITAQAQTIFENPEVTYIHVHSARNNCYQVRIDRG